MKYSMGTCALAGIAVAMRRTAPVSIAIARRRIGMHLPLSCSATTPPAEAYRNRTRTGRRTRPDMRGHRPAARYVAPACPGCGPSETLLYAGPAGGVPVGRTEPIPFVRPGGPLRVGIVDAFPRDAGHANDPLAGRGRAHGRPSG